MSISSTFRSYNKQIISCIFHADIDKSSSPYAYQTKTEVFKIEISQKEWSSTLEEARMWLAKIKPLSLVSLDMYQ